MPARHILRIETRVSKPNAGEANEMSSSNTDKIKGRLKEAAGALTGDEKLKKEGQLDQAAAEVKETVAEVVDKAKELLGGGKKDKGDD
jgi:uncharacterized protein YjbJ (UPF0337 family)